MELSQTGKRQQLGQSPQHFSQKHFLFSFEIEKLPLAHKAYKVHKKCNSMYKQMTLSAMLQSSTPTRGRLDSPSSFVQATVRLIRVIPVP